MRGRRDTTLILLGLATTTDSTATGPALRTCGADHGFIHHLAILIDADTDTLVKGTVIALD
jgi:hypothetical protein